MNEDSNIDSESLTEDQRAVAEYFASIDYRRRKLRPDDSLYRTWVLDHFALLDRDCVPTTSFSSGLLGLVGIVLFFGFMMPLEMQLIEEIFNSSRPQFVVQMIVFQTLLFPAVISFSFATVTPMFWYGSIVFRFAIAALMVVPGCFAFYLVDSWIDNFPSGNEFWIAFSAVMFAQFLSAGAVALTIQMWSPWTLSHARDSDSPLPSLGTRSMMELTVIAAVGFAVIVSVDTGEFIEGLLFFTVMGLLSSLAVISVLIAFLRRGHRNHRAAVIAVLFAFGTAFLMSGFFAAAEFGWKSIGYNFVLVSLVSLYGAALICGVMWLCLWWLRSCGWRCVSREEERQERKGQIKQATES